MHQTPRQNSSYMQARLAIKTRLIQILMKPHKKQWTSLSQTCIQTFPGGGAGRWGDFLSIIQGLWVTQERENSIFFARQNKREKTESS